MPTESDLSPLEVAILALLSDKRGRPIKGAIRLQKLAFLLAHLRGTPELRQDLDFESLHFGPFSEVLEDTVSMMASADLLEVDYHKPETYKLTDEGLKAAADARRETPGVFEESGRLKAILAEIPPEDLIALVYELYPDYAAESELKGIETANVEAVHVPMRDPRLREGLLVFSKKGTTYRVTLQDDTIALEAQ